MNARVMPGLSLLVVAALGCSGKDHRTLGSGTVNGTVNGSPFVVRDAMSAVLDLGANLRFQWIVLSDRADACAIFGDEANASLAQTIQIQLVVVGPNGEANTPTGPAAFTVYANLGGHGAGNAASFDFVKSNATCLEMTTGGNAGTVSVTSINGADFEGTLDVGLSSGDSLTGSFSATECPGLTTWLNHSNPSPPCE